MNKRRKRLNLTLAHFFPLSQYLGAAYVLISFPRVCQTTWLMPGREGSRLFLLLWPLMLLFFAALLDREDARARAKDAAELAAGGKYAGMNRATLLAMTTPLMLILDALAIVHLHIACHTSGTLPFSAAHTAAFAVGVVLYIYGRVLPRVPFGSVWGLATARNRQSREVWQAAHKRAARPVALIGAACIILSALLPASAALICAAALLLCASAVMFIPVNK